jgi:anhydro-N-acetylmuramic acid kinase
MEVSSDVLTGIGLMSGTSTDGLDIIAVTFEYKNDKIHYSVHESTTFEYNDEWRERLLNASKLSGLELRKLDIDFGLWMAEQVIAFSSNKNWKVDYIASHGHTVFHQPSNGFTLQIGNGAAIASKTGISTICDFRQGDISLGGQGAPLVPIGDELLFNDYTYCLNLGGFANVSYTENGRRIAFDISPLNVVLNEISRRIGMEFDLNGQLASEGKIISALLNQLNSIDYYKQKAPKSLGTEWVNTFINPILDLFKEESVPDLLATLGCHFAEQIGNQLQMEGKTLVTGGGAKNTWLINQIIKSTVSTMEIPTVNLIDNKESLIFALLGYLRYREEPNNIPSVTGAQRKISGGAIYLGN